MRRPIWICWGAVCVGTVCLGLFARNSTPPPANATLAPVRVAPVAAAQPAPPAPPSTSPTSQAAGESRDQYLRRIVPAVHRYETECVVEMAKQSQRFHGEQQQQFETLGMGAIAELAIGRFKLTPDELRALGDMACGYPPCKLCAGSGD